MGNYSSLPRVALLIWSRICWVLSLTEATSQHYNAERHVTVPSLAFYSFYLTMHSLTDSYFTPKGKNK